MQVQEEGLRKHQRLLQWHTVSLSLLGQPRASMEHGAGGPGQAPPRHLPMVPNAQHMAVTQCLLHEGISIVIIKMDSRRCVSKKHQDYWLMLRGKEQTDASSGQCGVNLFFSNGKAGIL